MTPEQQAAFIYAASACALVEAAGMTAENAQRTHRGESMAFVEEHFAKVIEKYGIHSNAVLTVFSPDPIGD